MPAPTTTPKPNRLRRQAAITRIIATTFANRRVDVRFFSDDDGPVPDTYSLNLQFEEPSEEPVSLGHIWHELLPALEAEGFQLNAASAATLSVGTGNFTLGIFDLGPGQ